jgi:hypothetical protein
VADAVVAWHPAVTALLRLAWKVLQWWTEVIIVTDKRS